MAGRGLWCHLLQNNNYSRTDATGHTQMHAESQSQHINGVTYTNRLIVFLVIKRMSQREIKER